MSIATVKHLTKNHVQITPAEGYSVILMGKSGNLEAIVAADDGSETIRLRIEPAAAGYTMSAKVGYRVVDIRYLEAADAY